MSPHCRLPSSGVRDKPSSWLVIVGSHADEGQKLQQVWLCHWCFVDVYDNKESALSVLDESKIWETLSFLDVMSMGGTVQPTSRLYEVTAFLEMFSHSPWHITWAL